MCKPDRRKDTIKMRDRAAHGPEYAVKFDVFLQLAFSMPQSSSDTLCNNWHALKKLCESLWKARTFFQRKSSAVI